MGSMGTRTAVLTSMLLSAFVLAGCGSGAEAPASPSDQASGPVDPDVYQDMLDGFAMIWQLEDPPPVEIVRVIDPSEWVRVEAECMAEQGWPKNADGSWPGIPMAQVDGFHRAAYICVGRYPIPSVYQQELSTAQLGRLYDYTVESLVPCLSRHDHEVSDIPSRETFVDSWSQDPWYPYQQVADAGLTQVEWDELQQTCPQTMPLNELMETD